MNGESNFGWGLPPGVLGAEVSLLVDVGLPVPDSVGRLVDEVGRVVGPVVGRVVEDGSDPPVDEVTTDGVGF